jgi:hypothetical protein
MDYGAAYGKERLSGRGYFTPTGSTSGVDLGNVEMFKVEFGIKRKEHFAARRGIIVQDRFDAYGSQVVWTITCDEFVSPILAYAWAGTDNVDLVQSAATATTFNFTTTATALKGTTWDIGKYGLFNASLTTPTTKTEGATADYVIDRAGGKIYITDVTTIPAGACVVTYSCPALTYDSVTALNILNRPGNLEVHGEDDSGSGKSTTGADAVPPVRYVFTIPAILSADESGEWKVDDYRKITFKASVTNPMTVKRLQT